MNNIIPSSVRGIIFDYGGTLDTNGVHWSKVLWRAYCDESVGITEDEFRECYVHAERELSAGSFIQPSDTFPDLLRIKADIETKYLTDHGYWQVTDVTRRATMEHIAMRCHYHVLENMQLTRRVLSTLAASYPLVLVSNFYGNLHAVLDGYCLDCFNDVIESSVVEVRKPDSEIFRLGVDALGRQAHEVLVVGDSLKNDILPATKLGCQTAWLKVSGWKDEPDDASTSTLIIHSLAELLN